MQQDVKNQNDPHEFAYDRWRRGRAARGVIGGAMLALVGILLLSRGNGVIPEDLSGRQLWPLVFVWLGLMGLTRRRSFVSSAASLGIAGFGVALVLEKLGLLTLGITSFWPAALVAGGILVALRAVTRPAHRFGHGPFGRGGFRRWHHHHQRHHHHHTHHQHQMVNADIGAAGTFTRAVVLAGAQLRCESKVFTQGSLTATMSGVSLDLRQAVMQGDRAVLEVACTMSGVEIYVPTSWRVEVDVEPTLGAVEDSTRTDVVPDGKSRVLVVRGYVNLGNVVLKN